MFNKNFEFDINFQIANTDINLDDELLNDNSNLSQSQTRSSNENLSNFGDNKSYDIFQQKQNIMINDENKEIIDKKTQLNEDLVQFLKDTENLEISDKIYNFNSNAINYIISPSLKEKQKNRLKITNLYNNIKIISQKCSQIDL